MAPTASDASRADGNAIGNRRFIQHRRDVAPHDRNSEPITLSTPPLQFDFQATTPCAQEVVQAMAPYWNELWGNPASRQHRLGLSASAAVALARRQIAETLAVSPERLIFTSGATKPTTWPCSGWHVARARAVIACPPSTMPCSILEQLKREGFRVTLLTPGPDGLIDPAQVEQAIATDTILVSVMAANNEIGVLQPLKTIAEVCRDHGIAIHSDAAQAVGHVPLQPDALGLDLISLSAHKLYGPKGVGASVRDGITLQPLQWGGGQKVACGPEPYPPP